MTVSPGEHDFIRELAQTVRDDQNARAELGWTIEPRPIDPELARAAERLRPLGHIAFAGAKLHDYSPEL